MADAPLIPAKRRSAQIQPPNRYVSTHYEIEIDHLDHGDVERNAARAVPTALMPDRSKTMLARNDSPDVGFRFSINPYRGCRAIAPQ
jgi:hypothetical protein